MADIPGIPRGYTNLPVRYGQSALAPTIDPAAGSRCRQGSSWPAWQPKTAHEQWWHYSRGCAAALRAGHPPAAVGVYGPVLDDGESALLSTDISYSRYRGASARYSPLPLIVGGRPAVMFGALAVQGVINHRRKTAAQRQAADQWRDHEQCGVIVTTDRLICSTTTHGQLSFWFGDCNEIHPDLQEWTLTLGLNSTYPVRLSGPAAPALSLLSARGVLGDRWQHDPRLAALL
ncbi:hypothetical protein [Mycobacterium sp.]|uniref:hypothetical protein n=1 Tax=Mycobacterium sp. TaxID=1785 RepID=UPI0031D22D43